MCHSFITESVLDVRRKLLLNIDRRATPSAGLPPLCNWNNVQTIDGYPANQARRQRASIRMHLFVDPVINPPPDTTTRICGECRGEESCDTRRRWYSTRGGLQGWPPRNIRREDRQDNVYLERRLTIAWAKHDISLKSLCFRRSTC